MTRTTVHDPILLHIGFHKTATKWLQHELFPDAGSGFKHCHNEAIRKLSWDIVFDHPLGFSASAMADRLSEETAKFQGTGFPVLSWERFSGSPHSGGFDSSQIAERLRDIFPQGRVLMVIREQRSIILSSYKQFVRAGGTCSLNDYVGRRRDVTFPVFRLDYFAYDVLIRHYQQLFGAANVFVLPYEMLIKDPGQFLDRLFATCGLDSKKAYPVSERRNAALRGASVSVKRRLNPFLMSESFNGYGPLRIKGLWRLDETIVAALDKGIPERLHRMADERRRAFISETVGRRFEASNKRTSELIGIDLGQYGYAQK